jgi:hypothetical protein
MNSSTGERKFGGGTNETHPRRQKRRKEKQGEKKNRYKASRKDRYRRGGGGRNVAKRKIRKQIIH